jgi:hypothetical protein
MSLQRDDLRERLATIPGGVTRQTEYTMREIGGVGAGSLHAAAETRQMTMALGDDRRRSWRRSDDHQPHFEKASGRTGCEPNSRFNSML